MTMSSRQASNKSSPNVLGISRTKASSAKCTPNILPCRIHHNGPVNASTRYWKPVKEADGTHTAYFRGRKLRGRQIRIPAGYEGLIVKKTDKIIQTRHPPEQEQDEDDPAGEDDIEDCGVMDEVAIFNDITVWNHEAILDDLENPYVRGIEELIAFAGAVHSYDRNPETTSKA